MFNARCSSTILSLAFPRWHQMKSRRCDVLFPSYDASINFYHIWITVFMLSSLYRASFSLEMVLHQIMRNIILNYFVWNGQVTIVTVCHPPTLKDVQEDGNHITMAQS